jgi:adenosine deaminase
MFRPFFLLLAFFLAACTVPSTTAPPPPAGEARTAAYLQQIRERPTYLDAFLRRMPKGGDLHSHFTGAVYAESYLRWAAEDGLCIVRATLSLAKPPCTTPDKRPASDANRDPVLYDQVINALSMRDFLPVAESGHDHFFNTFAKFDAAEDKHFDKMLAEVVDRSGAQSVSYLELMASMGMSAARKLGAEAGWDDDFMRLRDRLLSDPRMAATVAESRRQIDVAEASMRRQLRCDTQFARPGCAVTLRYLAQVIRIFRPEQVFAQFVLAFELARADGRIVGLNLVAPEDAPVAVRDYDIQMRMLGFLHRLSPEVKISLHAGEITPTLVPKEALRSRSAVEVAGASRIGHGVDVMGEDDAPGLLAEMARRRVMVEINLTSNDTILNVVGAAHPFEAYRRAGVPVALSTDDEGVSRIDLTHEFVRATTTYGLGYADLKTLVRNSLEYAFLPGESLWRQAAPFTMGEPCAGALAGTQAAPPACAALLGRSEKAAAQWRLETELARFESLTWPAP